MAFIDMVAYRRACAKARELVDPVTLTEAIYRVYELWSMDKDRGGKIVFHAYFGLSLFDLGIDDLFECEQYRKALGAYFNPRALLKLASLREQKLETPVKASANNVEFANSLRVRIRIDESVSIEFAATRRSGPLKWRHVDERFKVIHQGNGDVSDDDRHHARKQALQVLNSIRERSRKKNEA